jgi:hypothetical protein
MKDNLIFAGVREVTDGEDDACTTILDVIESKLEIPKNEVDISVAHRFGPRYKDRPRSIVVRFARTAHRDRVKRNRQKLKGSNIYINEQYPKEVEEKRKLLRPLQAG